MIENVRSTAIDDLPHVPCCGMRRLIAAAYGRGKRRSGQREAAQLASKSGPQRHPMPADEQWLNSTRISFALRATSLVTGKCFFTMSLTKHDLAARS
jgi:hypothetical protein